MIDSLILQQGADWRTQAEVFDEIFFVFLALGTAIGIIVVAYTLWNAYKYRDGGENGGKDEDFDAPVVGELPTGQGGPKAKKLFLSFGLSAIVVISLVVYAYGLLLYVEEGPGSGSEIEMEGDGDNLEVLVDGFQFGWDYTYANGHTETNEMIVPADTRIDIAVTSSDVWHNFGASELRFKADSIPGEMAYTWFSVSSDELEETEDGERAEFIVECFELCGSGHSQMDGTITVMPQDEFEEWYDDTERDDDGVEEWEDAFGEGGE